jgi:hypothetical protein
MSERIRRGIVIPTTDHVSATAIVIIAMTTLLSLKRTVSITGLRWFGPAQVVRCTAETIATLTQIVSFDTQIANTELPYVFHPTEERLGSRSELVRRNQQCPLWVISGHVQRKASCPLYPIATMKADIRKRSCLLCPRKRTCAVH